MSELPAPGSRPATAAEQAAFAGARHAPPGSPAEPLPYLFATDVTAAAVAEELVEGLLTAKAMSVIYGESGSGKTALVLDLACRLPLGWPWLGRRTRQSLVVYVAAEAGATILNRVLAFKQHHRIDRLPLALVTCPVDLLDPLADTGRLIALLRLIAHEQGAPVALVVVDTLSRALAGGNENAPDDMGALVLNGDRIRYATGAHLLWVHHSGKDSARGARGHSLLRAASDTEIEVTAAQGNHRARVTKQRDAALGGELAFALRQVEVGTNSWGDAITACVAEPAAGSPSNLPRRRPPKHTGMALRALQEALVAHGQPLPETSVTAAGVRAVSGKLWRARYNALVPLDDDASPAAARRAEETRRKQFARSRLALQEGFIDGINDHWWLK